MGSFTPSGQAEILRAAQKDDAHSSHLTELLSDIIFKVAGNRVWLKWRSLAQVSGKLAYYGLTTLSNFQTIGEEYTGIVQVDKTRRHLPSKLIRLLMILLDTCGQQVFLQALQRAERGLKDGTLGVALTPNAREAFLYTIATVRLLVPYLQRLHKAAFFLNGSYYHISKRLTGIHYVLVRPWRASQTIPAFRLLGVVSTLYLVAHAGHATLARWKNSGSCGGATNSRPSQPPTGAVSSRCSLCMEERKHTSTTPCGHLFCWDCVMQWLQTNPQCPLCREVVRPNRVVILQNYASKVDAAS